MIRKKELSGSLGTAIFLIPQVFGWLVFRPGYSLPTRLMVMIYMIVSTIPLYFMIVTLWTSGGDINQMARDFGANRIAGEHSAAEARGYMKDYEDGDLATAHHDNATTPVTTAALISAAESNGGHLVDRPTTITGALSAAPKGNIMYLRGDDTYPAVTLTFAGEAPAAQTGDTVTATCSSVVMATAGPKLADCR